MVECFLFVCFLFLLCFMEILWGAGVWEYAFFVRQCHFSCLPVFLKALQSYLLFPLMSCLVSLTITSTQFRGMSWEKLENPHGKLTLIHVVNVYLDV